MIVFALVLSISLTFLRLSRSLELPLAPFLLTYAVKTRTEEGEHRFSRSDTGGFVMQLNLS